MERNKHKKLHSQKIDKEIYTWDLRSLLTLELSLTLVAPKLLLAEAPPVLPAALGGVAAGQRGHVAVRTRVEKLVPEPIRGAGGLLDGGVVWGGQGFVARAGWGKGDRGVSPPSFLHLLISCSSASIAFLSFFSSFSFFPCLHLYSKSGFAFLFSFLSFFIPSPSDLYTSATFSFLFSLFSFFSSDHYSSGKCAFPFPSYSSPSLPFSPFLSSTPPSPRLIFVFCYALSPFFSHFFYSFFSSLFLTFFYFSLTSFLSHFLFPHFCLSVFPRFPLYSFFPPPTSTRKYSSHIHSHSRVPITTHPQLSVKNYF